MHLFALSICFFEILILHYGIYYHQRGNPNKQDVETHSVGGSYTYQAATDLTEIAG